MTTIDEEKFELIITENLTFSGDVAPNLEEAKEEIKAQLNEGEYEEDKPNVLRFLQYKLKPEDKIQILKNITEVYEESCGRDWTASIFDDDIINEGIDQWIEEKFKFSL